MLPRYINNSATFSALIIHNNVIDLCSYLNFKENTISMEYLIYNIFKKIMLPAF